MKEEVSASEADAFTHALAGGAGGAISMALTYPLVAITTKLQTRKAAASEDSEKTASIGETIKEIYRKDGIGGYFAGLESAIVGTTFSTFVYYYCYEASSRCVLSSRRKQKLNTAESMLVGTIAGSVNAAATNPLWVANTRMTVQKSERNTLGTLLEIAKTEGPTALFSGLKPALILVINPIIQYTVFEQLKNRVLESSQNPTLSPAWAFLLGAIGKIAATGITYPYVTMKARMHLAGKHESSALPKSLVSVMIEKVKNNGVSELYRGIGIKLVQSVLTAAFLFYFKEGLVVWSVRLLRVLSRFTKKNKRLLTAT
ncbi:LADA_0B03950g1_1 [Lachancea dasiensis]|uniref:LADA_0B03950g1_1 n=1 Tax=Lachancea dasiensis TaxID=1072105 RepID=A0A1G4ISL3_9SACH|nr:LADA_0B03950g1_1 [Lachancea dasiensis]